MRKLSFAAGLAAGYVLGARAGRERYHQIVEGARNLADQPAVAQAQAKVASLLGTEEMDQPKAVPAQSSPTRTSGTTSGTGAGTPSVGGSKANDKPATPSTSTGSDSL